MSESENRINIMTKAHSVLIKVMEIIDKELSGEMTLEEGVNASCYIGMGIITSNLMHCDDRKQRDEMANILIGHCIESIESSVVSLETMMPERPKGIILPN